MGSGEWIRELGRGAGVCRVCGDPVTDVDGRVNRRRSWHRGEVWEERNCLHEYKMQTDQSYIRKLVWLRDDGVCASCGVRDPEWDADHVVPREDGGGWGMENLQTLCRREHVLKTRLENGRRSLGRRLARYA